MSRQEDSTSSSTTRATAPKTIRILVFGATGHCGRCVVEQARQQNRNNIIESSGTGSGGWFFHVTVFCRDLDRAQDLFGSGGAGNKNDDGDDDDENDTDTGTISYVVGSIFSAVDVARAVQNVDVVFNCVSSYASPHTQMSTLIQNILLAKQQQQQKTGNGCQFRWLIHYGFPRGHRYYNDAVAMHQRKQQEPQTTSTASMGTALEHLITRMVKWCDCFKYGPAIRDHESVLDLLLASTSPLSKELEQDTAILAHMDYCIFAAPNMVAPKKKVKQRQSQPHYEGGPGSVNSAIQKSRVWHSVSPHDAADMLLSHVAAAVTTAVANGAPHTSWTTASIPPLVCFAYIQ